MTEELMSAVAFKWFLTICTGGLAGTWLVYDTISLVRLKPGSANAADKRFGYFVGIAIGVIGLWGCLRFHGVV